MATMRYTFMTTALHDSFSIPTGHFTFWFNDIEVWKEITTK
jgi:hypothetical protein